MNRVEKEMAKKLAAEREGLSEEQIRKLDKYEALVKDLHFQLFPEEYDLIMDSIADSKDRRLGKNPMTPAYAQKVNKRRKELGVPPLSDNGLPSDGSSWEFAKKEAQSRLA